MVKRAKKEKDRLLKQIDFRLQEKLGLRFA
jgi:hypothetical protein